MADATSAADHQPRSVGVIGLGYVGLPVVVAAARAGLQVVAFDVDADLVAALSSGQSHVVDVADADLASVAEAVTWTDMPGPLAEVDVIVICVPSPLGRQRQPDTSYLEAAAKTVTDVVRAGQTVILESTTYPGSTEDLLLPAVEQAGLVIDRDVWVAFSPERIDPGNPLGLGAIPKVVGGVSVASGERAAAFYRRIFDEVHVLSSARAAELTKLLENTYRSVNIALVNEMAQLARPLDIDIWEVIEAAATKPFGFQPFWPGPGVGGHCIPLDPQYLAWRAKEARTPTRFIDLAQQINDAMPRWVVDRVVELLNDLGQPVRGANVLAVGVAYKPNVADDRESPAWDVITQLQGLGAHVAVLDPMVDPDRLDRHGVVAADPGARGEAYDLAIVLTDHDGVDYAAVAGLAARVFDTRNAYRRRGLAIDRVVTL